MIIKLNDEYRIHSDEFQWTLEQRYVRKKGANKGEEYWRPKGHFNTLEGTLYALLERKVRFTEGEVPSEALEALLESLGEFKQEISRNISAALKESLRGISILRR